MFQISPLCNQIGMEAIAQHGNYMFQISPLCNTPSSGGAWGGRLMVN